MKLSIIILYGLLLPLLIIPPLQAQPSECSKFSDTPYHYELEEDYISYRGLLKVQEWEKAYPLWKRIYELSPAADGYRSTIYKDGIRFYEYFITTTQDSLQKDIYVDSIFMLYDQMEICYPSNGLVPARKGFDLFYKYPYKAKNRKEIYHYFIKAIEIDNFDANDFILRPLAELIIELFDTDEISKTEAHKYITFINDRLTKGLKDCKGVQCARWEIAEQYIPKRFEFFERIKGFYPCEYYMKKYYAKFEAKPEDCDMTSKLYAFLKLAECDENDERFKNVYAVLAECEKPKPGTIICGGKRPSYQDSLHKYKVAFALETDSLQKAKLSYNIAFIYCFMAGYYNKARTWAAQSIEYNPNSGAPYLLIGDAYSKSRRYCGIGKGWASNATIWAAIDMWEKAKAIDVSMTEKADKRINSYWKLLPTKEEISSQQMSVGDTYFVECWIHQAATIRSRD